MNELSFPMQNNEGQQGHLTYFLNPCAQILNNKRGLAPTVPNKCTIMADLMKQI